MIHNFSNHGYRNYDIPLPGSYPNVKRIQAAVQILSTDDPKYGGSGAFQNEQIEIKRHNGKELLFAIALPPLSTIILEETLD